MDGIDCIFYMLFNIGNLNRKFDKSNWTVFSRLTELANLQNGICV